MAVPGATAISDAAPEDVPNATFQFVIAAYLGVWLVSLILVFVYTRREQVALVRDIRRLQQRLADDLNLGLNSRRSVRGATPLAVVVAPSGGAPPPAAHRVALGGGDSDSDDDDEGRRPLVVPSTPETKNLILALANGEDVDDSLFADLPAAAYKEAPAVPAVGLPLHGLSTRPLSLLPPATPAMSVQNESIMFMPSQADDSRPHLLLRASAVPRIPNLWRRMFNISSAKFLPEDIDTAAKHLPDSPARARFVEPLAPITPLAARVHRLILAAIEADLKVLEARFKKDAVRYPPILFTFIGFQMLAVFLFLFGSGLSSWPKGLATLLLVVCCSLGFEILVSVLIRDLLTDLKAERAVLILSNKRVKSRAPYYLTFQATTYTHHMSASEYLCIPFVGLFSWWAVPLAKAKYGASSDTKVHVRAPPRSLGGAVGLDEVIDEEGGHRGTGACLVLNGRLSPTVWNVTAELRVPKDGLGGGQEVVVNGEEDDYSGTGILKKGGRMGTNDTVVVV
ncbi:hypothetical protein BDR26DRAFT_870488 [Obelidium mucronatum]|nr:hypothetical protein BDR26DRAFT_870488 [Obelidium mucronatum]